MIYTATWRGEHVLRCVARDAEDALAEARTLASRFGLRPEIVRDLAITAES